MAITELTGAITQLLIFSIVPFIWWLIFGRKKENFFKWIGLKKGKCEKSFLLTILVAIGTVIAYAGLTGLCVRFLPEGITSAGSQFNGLGAEAIPAVIFYGYIRTGLAEEILFRGFLLKRLSAKFGFVTGNIVQGLLFGLLHGIPFGLATGNVMVTILLTLLPGAFGYFQGWLNEKRFEGSIIPSWFIHGTMNTIIGLLGL